MNRIIIVVFTMLISFIGSAQNKHNGVKVLESTYSLKENITKPPLVFKGVLVSSKRLSNNLYEVIF